MCAFNTDPTVYLGNHLLWMTLKDRYTLCYASCALLWLNGRG